MAQQTPIVYDDTTGEHRPAAAGETITSQAVPIDPSANNLLTATTNGLLVSSSALPQVKLLSTQEGNYLRYGNDQGLFVDGNDILSNGDDNLVIIDPTDKKIKLTREAVAQAAAGSVKVVSADAGNALVSGSDGGAYLDASSIDVNVDISTRPDNVLRRDSADALLVSTADIAAGVVGAAAGNLLTKDSSDKLQVLPSDIASGIRGAASDNLLTVDSTGKLQVLPSAVTAGVVSPAAGNMLATDAAGKLLLSSSQLVSADAGNAVVPGTDGKLFVQKVTASGLVDANDKILVVSNTGTTVSTVVSMTYDTTTGLLSLLGKNGQLVSSVTVQSSGSVLKHAEIVVNPAGQPAGTYLALTFELVDGTESTVYADLSALATYTAGSGVSISSGNVISAKLAANGGLEFASDGGLKVSASVLEPVSVDSGNIISNGADGKAFLFGDLGTM